MIEICLRARIKCAWKQDNEKGLKIQKGNFAKAIPFFDFMSIGMINLLFM